MTLRNPTLRLRAPTETAMKALLKKRFPACLDENDNWVTAAHTHALDVLGPVVNKPAVWDADGNIVTPAQINNSFHVNLRILNGTQDVVFANVFFERPPDVTKRTSRGPIDANGCEGVVPNSPAVIFFGE